MKENDNIKKMAAILRSGATMLDRYCPKCDNILFRLKNNNVFCPVCEQNVEIIYNTQTKTEENPSQKDSILISRVPESITSFVEINNSLSKICTKFIGKLTDTDDVMTIERILSNIDKIIDIIRKIRQIEK